MDERDKIVKDLLSELENRESVDNLFSANVMSRIEGVKEVKKRQRASMKYLGTIVSIAATFIVMVYIVIFVLFDISISISPDKEMLSSLFNFSAIEKLVGIWQNGGYIWSMIGGSAFLLLILQQFLSKKLEHYNETNSISSSGNSRLNA